MSARTNSLDRVEQPDFDLDEVIRELRAEQATLEQARALERRVVEKLGARTPGGTENASQMGAGAWCRLLALVGLGSVGMLSMRASHLPEPRNPETTMAVTPAASQVPSIVPGSSPWPAEVVEAVVTVPPSPIAKPHRSQHRPRVRSATVPVSAVAPMSDPRQELEVLSRARDALRSHPTSDPASALTLTEQHARDFPNGVFAEEREVIAIEALFKQDRDAQAIARATRFRGRYADSPYASLVRGKLAQTPQLPPSIACCRVAADGWPTTSGSPGLNPSDGTGYMKMAATMTAFSTCSIASTDCESERAAVAPERTPAPLEH